MHCPVQPRGASSGPALPPGFGGASGLQQLKQGAAAHLASEMPPQAAPQGYQPTQGPPLPSRAPPPGQPQYAPQNAALRPMPSAPQQPPARVAPPPAARPHPLVQPPWQTEYDGSPVKPPVPPPQQAAPPPRAMTAEAPAPSAPSSNRLSALAALAARKQAPPLVPGGGPPPPRLQSQPTPSAFPPAPGGFPRAASQGAPGSLRARTPPQAAPPRAALQPQRAPSPRTTGAGGDGFSSIEDKPVRPARGGYTVPPGAEESYPGASGSLMECHTCGRSFNQNAFSKHAKVGW